MKTSKIISRIIIAIFLIAGLGFGIFLAWGTIKDYHPAPIEQLTLNGKGMQFTEGADTLSLLTWNIGYGGLGREMDFFYEGGKQVRPSAGELGRYFSGIMSSLAHSGYPDFIFIQEADRKSKRSRYIDEAAMIDSIFNGYASVYATNYRSGFVPVPLTDPMGQVEAGLMTLSRYKPAEAERVAYPSSYSWPKRLFMLDRCFILTRIKISAHNDLVLINTHNSAFTDAAEMRKKELALLHKTITDEYAKGNYVITGGDWNQNPLPFDTANITDGNKPHLIIPPIPADFLPAGWKWAFDSSRASNRDVNEPYLKGHTGTTIIDFFVVSPNVELLEVKTLAQDFEYSDHQAVGMKVRLLK
jgi:endonuclease/exonuclease/phosphatase family metal-dependent hydrolase